MIRKNFGCSHFMVANDHGGPSVGLDVSLFYQQGAAQQLVADMERKTGMEMVPELPMGYVEEKDQYVFLKNVGESDSVKTITSQELKRRLEWGLSAKARKGLIQGVTGISDPYIPPVNPELTIDTSTMTPAAAVQEIMLYLEEQRYVS